MKAQILKIAGVKNEKEFYKKFPTEAAFMKKHGKQLKKAIDGDIVPSDALDYMSNGSMPSDYQGTDLSNIGQGAFGGIDKFINSDFSGTVNSKKGFDWKGLAGKTAPVLGSIIGGIQQIGQENKDIANARKYAQISDLTLQAASSRPEQTKRKYLRPEDQLTQTVNPLGVGTNYLAAENGAEIANYYSSPDTIYTDGGFEPLNDSNVKQYKKGGKLKKADGGLNLDPFAGVAGGLGGALGSATGKGSGKGGAASSIGSTIGGIAGSFLPIPGVGTALGSLVGGFAGGLFDAGRQNELQEAEDKLNKNLQASAFQSGASSFQSQNKAFVEDGGWVSHDWQPQVIATFGEHKLKDLLKPPHDADMLRAGGHLKYYTPPTERAMYTGKAEYGSQMAFGGDIKVGNGYMKPLSDDVQKLIGPSHEEGGMPFANGGNLIEAEGDETVMKTYADGGGVDDGSVTIFGNRFINKDAAEFAGVKPGKKYKKESEQLALTKTKFQDKATKNFASANEMEPDDSFTQIAQKTKLLNGEAFTTKANEITGKLKKLAIYQNETDDVARSQKLDINAFDKGIMKPIKESDMAKFGAKLETAYDGKKSKYDPEFNNFIDQAMQLEQANSFQAGDYRGGGSNFGTNNPAIKTPEQAKEYYHKNYWSKVKDLPAGLRTRALQMAINTGDPYGELMVAAGKMSVADRAATKGERKDKNITGNKSWETNKADILKAYKKDPEGFLGKLDTEQNRYYDSLVKANTKEDGKAFGVNPDTLREFYDDYTGLARFASQDYIPSNDITPIAQPATVQTPITAPVTREAAIAQTPVKQVPVVESKKIGTLDEEPIIIENKNVRKQPPVVKAPTPYSISSSQFPSPTDAEGNYYMPVSEQQIEPGVGFIDPRNAGWSGTDDYQYQGSLPANTQASAAKKSANDWVDPLLTGISSIAPFLRPGVGKPLDPSQLVGEMFALSTNQLEPVQAQLYSPMLQAQPYRISLQDQLNEVTAGVRGAERLAQGNPAALSMIAAQGEQAKSKILGEQFRLNQSEQARTAEANRAQVNDAQLKNLGILDQLYARQAEAKSKTKAQTIEALKSIAAKQAQNKYENLQANVAANMYNYRFTPEGVAYNLNPPAQWNMSGADMGRGKGTLAPGYGYTYDENRNIIGTRKLGKSDDTTAKNGAIVKAIKNL